MGTKKVLGIIFSIIFLCAFAFVLTWGIINFNKVKEGMSGTGIYTKEDIDKAYQDGYDTSLKDKAEYEKLINDYRDKINILNNNIKDYENTLLEKNNTIENYKLRLSSAESDRDRYQSLLETSESNNAELQAKYDLEVTKVNNLKIEINKLKEEKNEIQVNLTNAQNRINELNQTVIGYENFIQGLISENQVVAKFYYDNSLYSVMVLQKGDTATISNPADTTYKKFLGWMVDNEVVDISSYPINENVTFVAKINRLYDVKFVIDDTEYDSDIVVEGAYSKVPTIPSKVGYEFDGWAIDNVVYDVNIYPIIQNTTFVAKFTKINSVTFNYKESNISTQSIRTGEYASMVYPETDEYTQFNYWEVNGIRVDIETYPITSDVVFVANITNKYDVKFIYEDSEYSKQIVLDGSCPTSVTPTSTEFKVFKGWSKDKIAIIDVTTTPITENTIYYAMIDYYYIVSFKLDNETTYGSTQLILKNNVAELPANPTKDGYEFDYWTLNNNEIDVTTNAVTSNTTYYAKFTKLHNVAFCYKDTTINTQVVRNNEYAQNQQIESTNKEVFNGWKVNGTIVNVSEYPITSDVAFVADITYKSLVEFKIYDDVIQSTYVVNGSTATSPDMTNHTDYTFQYWTLNDSQVDVNSITINSDTTFVAKVTRKTYTSTFTQNNYKDKTTYSSYINYTYELKNVSDFNKSNFNGFDVVGTIKIGSSVYDINVSTYSYRTITIGGYEFAFSGTYYNSFGVTVYNTSNISFELNVKLSPNYGISGL